jgi:4a-hydroxytetrahydrobiopterin dehydratase
MTGSALGWPSDEDLQAAGGLDAWRVLPQGVYAHWRTASFADAVAFTARVGEAASARECEPDIDVRATGVTVRVGSYETAELRTDDVETARAISSAADEMGLVADPSALLVLQIAVAEAPGVETRRFWQALTGYDSRGDDDASDPQHHGPNLWFHALKSGIRGRGRIHVDLAFPREYAAARIRRALAQGGKLVDDSHAPDWITLASPDNHGVDVPGPLDTGDLPARPHGSGSTTSA